MSPSPARAEIDRDAPVVARHETRIAAPLEVVWRLHIGVADWPDWQPDISDLAYDAPVLHAGGWFTWSSGALHIRSDVQRVDPDAHETFWGGPAQGIDGWHHWRFADDAGGTRVVTEESWDGDAVRHDVPTAQKALDVSLESWLGHLRAAAERDAAR